MELGESLKNKVEISIEVEMGFIGLIVNEVVKDEVDFIVVGICGEDGKFWWMSSVFKDVIDYFSVFVLVVLVNIKYVLLECISFVIDLCQVDVFYFLCICEYLLLQEFEICCLYIVINEKEKMEMSFVEFVYVFSKQLDDMFVMFY